MKVQLQHRIRREGGIKVGTTQYTLNEQGVVEVTKEHAVTMLQGAAWRQVLADGSMPWAEPPPAPPMKPGAAGRRPRTREELLGLADVAGVPPVEAVPFDARGRPVEQDKPEPEASAAPQAAAGDATAPDLPPEPEPETIEVSMDNTRAELLEACDKLEIEVPKGVTKAQLLDLIREHGD